VTSTAPLGHANAGHRSAAGLGVISMLGSSLLLTFNDAVAKWLMTGLPISQFMASRGLVMLAVLLLFIIATRRLHVLRIWNRKAMLLRCTGMIASSYLFLAALKAMPMADTYALAFASPIIALILAVLFLNERVGWRRWLAVIVGFGGVCVAMVPTGQGYLWTAALLPLASAFGSALRDVSSRRLSATDTTLGIMVYTTLSLTLAGFAGWSFEPWTAHTEDSLALILGSAALQASAHWLQIEAYRCAEVSFLMPFRYLSLVFATAVGFAVWGDVPAWNVALGSVIIIGSGLFIWYRERRVKRLAASPA
jgi:drug/metabolite transporter (DMT)-like permease